MFKSILVFTVPIFLRIMGILASVLIAIPTFYLEPPRTYLIKAFLISLGINALLLSAHQGFQYSIEKNKYKRYWSILGLKIGRWRVLPALKEIYLYRGDSAALHASLIDMSSGTTFNATTVAVFLVTLDGKKIPIAYKGSRKAGLKVAFRINELLNVQICDYTKRNKEYL